MPRSIVLTLLVFICANLPAQKFDSYLNAGISASQIDGDKLNGYHKLGAVFGWDIIINIADEWKLNTGLQYIGKGAKVSPNMVVGDYLKTQLNYVSLPIVLQYYQNRLYFEAGVLPGYLFNAYVKDIEKYKRKDDGYYNNLDLPLCLGIGWKLTDQLNVGMRINYSLLSIAGTNSSTMNVYSLAYQLNNTISITLSKKLNKE